MTEVKKTFTGKNTGKSLFIGALAMISTGLFMYIFLQPPYGHQPGLLAGAVVSGLFIACLGLYYYVKERNMTVYDERSARVNAQAGYVAFILSWVMLDALAIASALGILRIGYDAVVWITVMAMPWVFVILRFALGRRGGAGMSILESMARDARKGTGILLALLALLSLAVAVEYLLGIGEAILTITIVMTFLMVVIVVARVFLADLQAWRAPDERIRKGKARALSYSWIVTLTFITALRLGSDVWHWDVSMDSALTYTLIVMLYSFLGLYWYYGRKPDVELV